MKISVVIITYNEERNLRRCLESVVQVANEIVVVDSFSKDGTEAIAREFEARFIQHPFEGHIQQKNWAKDQASFDWVLSLDADEALSEELRDSILELKEKGPKVTGYIVNRLTNYSGHWMRHGGWYPDRKLRLWKKNAGSWGGRNPHDRFEMKDGSSAERLQGDLLHYSIDSIEHHAAMQLKYADIASDALLAEGKGGRAWKRFVSPWFKFLQDYFFRMGFLDGKMGFYGTWHACRGTYLKYLMLHQKVQKLRSSEA